MSRKIRLKRKATNFPGKHPRKKQCAPNTALHNAVHAVHAGNAADIGRVTRAGKMHGQARMITSLRDLFGL